MTQNDISVRPDKCQIVISGQHGTLSKHSTQPAVRGAQSFLLHDPQCTVILSREYVQLDTPGESTVDPTPTVQGLCSFAGTYKVLSCVLPRVVELLDPLKQAFAGGKDLCGLVNYSWLSKLPNLS